MRLSNVKIIYRKELTESLRDRRTLISMVVVPMLLVPVLMIGIGGLTAKLLSQVRGEKAKIMIMGPEHAPDLVARLSHVERFEIVSANPKFRELISNKEIRAAVEIPDQFQVRMERGEQPEIAIYHYESELKSQTAVRDIERVMADYRKELVRKRLEASRLSEKILEPFVSKQTNVAAEEKVSGQRFGGLFPYLVIIMSLTGAMYPAIDLTAGEKERGTIETILVSPAGRMEIVLGKFLTVLTASVATAALSLTSLAFSLTVGINTIGAMSNAREMGMQFKVTPASVLMALLMILPVTVLFSSMLLAIALTARSYKEAQSYISPLMIVMIIPAVASLLPGMELDLGLSFIPVLGTSLVVKEILTHVYHWNLIGVTFAVSTIYASIALLTAFAMFNRESVLFRT